MLGFISYSHHDSEQFTALKKQLKPLADAKLLNAWHDQKILAGDSWDEEIQKNLAASAIILLCVSPDFLWSDYINSVELDHAMERHRSGSARIIPVIFKDCLWGSIPFLAALQAVPRDGKPVQDWKPQNKGMADAARRIQSAVKAMANGKAAP